MAEQEQETFEIVTTAQVERTYTVTASDDEQAKKRLRTFLQDADMLREGVVVEQEDKRHDTTTQQMKDVKKITRPRVVKDKDKEVAGATT